MFRASAHLPVKTWKILMERKSGSSGKHQTDLPLGGPCSWCHNTTHADRLQKTCFTGVSDISTTISLIDVVTDASFTSDLWIPAAVMQRKNSCAHIKKDTEIPPSERWCTFISHMCWCLGAVRWTLSALTLQKGATLMSAHNTSVFLHCHDSAGSEPLQRPNCCSVES